MIERGTVHISGCDAKAGFAADINDLGLHHMVMPRLAACERARKTGAAFFH